MKWKLLAIIATSLALLLALYAMLRPKPDIPASPLPTARYIAAEGKLEAQPDAEMAVGSELIARIEHFNVNEGDHVAKGQVIALLDSRDLTARLKQAEAELAVNRARYVEVAAGSRRQEIRQARAALQRSQAEQALANSEYRRNLQLYQDGFVSQATLEHVESAYKVATARAAEAVQQLQLLQAGPRSETLSLLNAQVTQADASVRYIRSLLDKTRVLSPISGTLIERYLNVGEIVIPEKPIVVIADTTQLRINAEVDETDAGRLHLGDVVTVSAYAYPGSIYRGRVAEIADYVGKREIKPNNPAVNLGLKIIQVKIELLEETPLKLGMTVDVRITPTEPR